MVCKFGAPSTSVRPEASIVWVLFSLIAALTFILLGSEKWLVLPDTHTASLLMLLNIMSIILSTLILHLGFFGRLLTLYMKNLNRVKYLSEVLDTIRLAEERGERGGGVFTDHEFDSNKSNNNTNNGSNSHSSEVQEEKDGLLTEDYTHILDEFTQDGADVDAWWACRNFVLGNDISIDYDVGGLAMGAAFMLDITVFVIVCVQVSEMCYVLLVSNIYRGYI